MTTCTCRCDQCLDSDCQGEACNPWPPGTWRIRLRDDAHPLPSRYDNEGVAQHMADVLRKAGFRTARAEQVPA